MQLAANFLFHDQQTRSLRQNFNRFSLSGNSFVNEKKLKSYAIGTRTL